MFKLGLFLSIVTCLMIAIGEASSLYGVFLEHISQRTTAKEYMSTFIEYCLLSRSSGAIQCYIKINVLKFLNTSSSSNFKDFLINQSQLLLQWINHFFQEQIHSNFSDPDEWWEVSYHVKQAYLRQSRLPKKLVVSSLNWSYWLSYEVSQINFPE